MANKTNKKLKSKKSNNLGKLPVWDLSDLYKSTKDKKITSDLNFVKYTDLVSFEINSESILELTQKGYIASPNSIYKNVFNGLDLLKYGTWLRPLQLL